MALPGYLSAGQIAQTRIAIERTHYTAAVSSVTLEYVSPIPIESAHRDSLYDVEKPGSPATPTNISLRAANVVEKQNAQSTAIGEQIECDAIIRVWLNEMSKHGIDTSISGLDNLTKSTVTLDGDVYRIQRVVPVMAFFDGTFLAAKFYLQRKGRR